MGRVYYRGVGSGESTIGGVGSEKSTLGVLDASVGETANHVVL